MLRIASAQRPRAGNAAVRSLGGGRYEIALQPRSRHIIDYAAQP